MIELINLCKEFKKPVREEGLKGMFKIYSLENILLRRL